MFSDFDDSEFDDLDDENEGHDCGFDEDFEGICHHVGSEHCSFWCPLHAVYFADKNVEALKKK